MWTGLPFVKNIFLWVRDYYELQYRGRRFILCCYPLRSWNGMRRGAFQLHGHQHNPPRHNECNRKMGIAQLDMGVDAQAMAPISIEELLVFWEEKYRPDEYWGRIKPAELRLEMTCRICPEPYDVFGKDGQYLGYLHLRGGFFTVNCLRPGDKFEEPISEYSPEGWHAFHSDQERSAYLAIARRDIAEFYRALEQRAQFS